MNLSEVVRRLLRRWYIVVPGLILAVAVAAGAWFLVKPDYERSASQMLVPGTQSMPENSNPLLYLGGLSNAADVLVRAVGSTNVLNEIAEQYPKAEVEVSRDVSTAGPLVLVKVTASSDAEAEGVLAEMVDRTTTELEALQDDERISADNRITLKSIYVDQKSVLQEKNRLIATAGVGVVTVAFVLLVAGLLDGLLLQRRRRGSAQNAVAVEAVPAEVFSEETAEIDVIEERPRARPKRQKGAPITEFEPAPEPSDALADDTVASLDAMFEEESDETAKDDGWVSPTSRRGPR